MNARYILGCIAVLLSIVLAVAEEKEIPQLNAKALKVGVNYKTDGGARSSDVFGNTWGKIVQVIDDDNMLVGIDNGADDKGGPRYSVVVMCKFPTKGLTDGEKGFLTKFLGTDQVTVSGTTQYKTTDGGTRTVFVLEPSKKPAVAVALPESLETLRDDVLATAAAAKEMMQKESVSLNIKNWVIEFVNGKKPPKLNAADLKAANEMLMKDEIKKWIEAENKYVKEKAKKR